MKPDFTVEEMAFIKSVRETAEGMLERIPCIRTISYLMARANSPEMILLMDRVQNKLGMMTDREYAEFDFSVDMDEMLAEENAG
ncbi:MAG: hypothetical protein IJM27_03635 [Eubacterium sp.]|nr:hypothetical protein [Eubacterium sp.]